MRHVMLFLAVIAAAAGADAAMAGEKDRPKPKRSTPQSVAAEKRLYDDRDKNGWYPRDANQLKIGSQIWWEQMEREGRLGIPDN